MSAIDALRFADDDDLLTRAEVAEIFRVAPKTLSRWVSEGRIDSVRTPQAHRCFRAADVRRLLDGDQ